MLARGKGLYESSCAACHGIDLRGGQQGGPNLLRSQTLLSDKAGELIAPIVTGGRPNPPAGAPPMPAFPLPPADITAIAEYLHSVLGQAGNQGRPPEGELVAPEQALVGNAAAGQSYVAVALRQLPLRSPDLQDGGRAGQRSARSPEPMGIGRRGRRPRRARRRTPAKPITVTVTPASGPAVARPTDRVWTTSSSR